MGPRVGPEDYRGKSKKDPKHWKCSEDDSPWCIGRNYRKDIGNELLHCHHGHSIIYAIDLRILLLCGNKEN